MTLNYIGDIYIATYIYIYTPTFMRSVCNQKMIPNNQWNKLSNPFFPPIWKGGDLFAWKKGCTFKSLNDYTFKEPIL